MTGEELLDKTALIECAVQDIINEFYDHVDDTDAYHFKYRIDEWLTKNQGDDPDVLAQKWLEDEGYRLIRERILYFG